MDIWDVEGNAAEMFDRASVDPKEPVGVGTMVRRLLGKDGLCFVRRSTIVTSVAKLCKVSGSFRIYAKRDAPDLAFNIAHELAEWRYWDETDDHKESACDALAAAIVAPRPAFLRMLRLVGEDFAALAHAFKVSETSMALRLGETTDQPLVAITRNYHFVRGREWGWPAEPELRRIASRGRQGIRRVRLTDDRMRVVLMAEDVV